MSKIKIIVQAPIVKFEMDISQEEYDKLEQDKFNINKLNIETINNALDIFQEITYNEACVISVSPVTEDEKETKKMEEMSLSDPHGLVPIKEVEG